MTVDPTTPSNGRARGVSRRTLVTGTAWAVPAVVVATAAPAAAASCTVAFSVNQQHSCVVARSSLYYLQLCVTGSACTFSSSAVISFTLIGNTGAQWGGGEIAVSNGTGPSCGFPQSALIPVSEVAGNSITVTYSLDRGPTQQTTVTLPSITTTCPFG